LFGRQFFRRRSAVRGVDVPRERVPQPALLRHEPLIADAMNRT
jgi:hypothetical protein